MALKTITVAALCAAAQLSLVASPARAAEPSITSVSPDAGLTTVEIRGASFPSLALPPARQMKIYLRGFAAAAMPNLPLPTARSASR